MAKYALITGASSGIGLEFARIAASQKINLILLARNSDKMIKLRTELEENYSIKVLAIGCDLSESDAIEKITSLLHRRSIVPDILINNAGAGIYGPFSRLHANSEMKMIQLNITSLTELTKIIYRQMRKRRKGKILNVSSIAGFLPNPWMAAYSATKAYVLSFSQALAYEAIGSGVTVTTLCPGPTNTDFENRASDGKGIKTFKKNIVDAASVAKYGWKSMMKGKKVAIYCSCKLRILLFLSRFFPRKIVVNIAGKMLKPDK